MQTSTSCANRPRRRRRRAVGVGDRRMIFGHRRRGLADREKWVAYRPIKTEPGSTMLVFHEHF